MKLTLYSTKVSSLINFTKHHYTTNQPTIRRSRSTVFWELNKKVTRAIPRFIFKTLKNIPSSYRRTRTILFLLADFFPFISRNSLKFITNKTMRRLNLRHQAYLRNARLIRLPKKRALQPFHGLPFSELTRDQDGIPDMEIPDSDQLPMIFYNTWFPYRTLLKRYRSFPRSVDLPTSLILLRAYYIHLTPNLQHANVFALFRTGRWLRKWLLFLQNYISFCEVTQNELYLKSFSKQIRLPRYVIRFRFLGPKLAISLVDDSAHKNYFFLSPGLFLKYFNRKRSLKKNKSMKLLMMRFLRKMLLVLKLKNLILRSKGVPLFFETLLNMLYQPIAHPFKNPLTEKVIAEVKKRPRDLNISELTFTHPKPYGSMKSKKRGRIKRKVRRKVMKVNRVIDEM